ncbi:quercetin 2,3-dioxygenase [Rubritalea halochordaticola]|uniref:Quercetin 2,3-dioxygenase n=1 Tax=Rubritalea halochordaticola TaxID=714537 RepID=A0ABP9V303_9BACT
MTTKQNITIRRSEERGHANHGWLDSYHSFSFARYYDPAHMGFRSLRVINQDVVAPGGGFPTHPHDNMEIFSYVLRGALSHEDSMGNRKTLHPGEIQLMSAGSGITHSEFNHSSSDPVELLQIWLTPTERNLTPSYTEWKPNEEQTNASKTLLISPDGREHSATIHQDALIYRVQLKAGESVPHELTEGRGAWLQLIKGELKFNDTLLHPGDAASTEDPGTIQLSAISDAEALLFDLN